MTFARSIARTILLLASCALAIAAPVCLGLAEAQGSGGAAELRPVTPPLRSAQARVMVQDTDRFDWADAAVGSAAALGLLLLVAGGEAAWTRRRAARGACQRTAS